MVLDVLMLVLRLVFWLDVLFDALCWFFMAILLLMFELNALGFHAITTLPRFTDRRPRLSVEGLAAGVISACLARDKISTK